MEETVFRPEWWAAFLPWVGRWSAEVIDEEVQVRADGRTHSYPLVDIGVSRRHGWFWSTVYLTAVPGRETLALPGLPSAQADHWVAHLAALRDRALTRLRGDLQEDIRLLEPVAEGFRSAMSGQRFAPSRLRHRLVEKLHDVQERIERARDRLKTAAATRLDESARLRVELDAFTPELIKDPAAALTAYNHRFLAAELVEWRPFFDHCEERPLTTEQARAAISGEENTLLVAAAGSGKTSTVVGRVAYAIAKGLAAPRDVVCLAFNNDAAQEIGKRVKKRLAALMAEETPISAAIKSRLVKALASGEWPESKTFHGLGREVVRTAENAKRRVVMPAESKRRFEEALKQCLRQPAFAADWLLLQVVMRFPQPDDSRFATLTDYEAYLQGIWSQRKQRDGILTLGSDRRVKSFDEVGIANWLYQQGVEFDYEEPFEEGAAVLCPGAPWTPDFTYWLETPAGRVRIVHEHFGLNAQGQAPHFFNPGYAEKAARKREVLAALDDRHFWTTSAEYREGSLFPKLERVLRELGVPLHPRPIDEVLARLRQIGIQSDNDLLERAVSQVRQNGWDRTALDERALGQPEPIRAAVFVNTVLALADTVSRRLDAEHVIDFDGMVGLAVQYARARPDAVRYRFVVADEFQDTAPGRGELVRLLLAGKPDATFFAVGDDWQSINRFAGSDLEWFHGFSSKFGAQPDASVRCDLTQTFRSNQGIADVARRFVLKNTTQLSKVVKAHDQGRRGVVDVRTWKDDEDIVPTAEAVLESWLAHHAGAEKPTVMLLSRYSVGHTAGLDQDVLTQLEQRWSQRVSFVRSKDDTVLLTIHRSKGLQADYVLIFGLFDVRHSALSFPSEREDDPLMRIVLPTKEAMSDADERRLFYVALTRAKHRVALLANETYPSSYAMELLHDHRAGEVLFNGTDERPPQCRYCRTGFMVRRRNKKTGALFWGCSQWPKCKVREA